MTRPAPLYTEEQQIIADSVQRFLQENYSFDQRQKAITSERGFSQEHWQNFAELGWLGLPFSEEQGGFGGSLKDAAIITGLLGEYLAMTPYLTAVISAGQVLANFAPGNVCELVEGSKIVSCPHFDFENSELTVSKQGGAFTLSGDIPFLPYAESASSLVLHAEMDGDWATFLIPTDSSGLNLKSYKTYDGGRASDAELQSVPAQLLSAHAKPALEASNLATMALLCAEASSILWALEEQTLAYLQTREQFGQKLSSFQVLQHRLVDVYVNCQLAQSMADDAVEAVSNWASDAPQRVSAAKAYIGDLGRKIGQDCVQLHGGIGMTNDLPIGHYLKRLTAIDRLYGDAAWHRNQFAMFAETK